MNRTTAIMEQAKNFYEEIGRVYQSQLTNKHLTQLADIVSARFGDDEVELIGESGDWALEMGLFTIKHNNDDSNGMLYEGEVHGVYFKDDLVDARVCEEALYTRDEFMNFTPHSINIEGFDPLPSMGCARVNEENTIVNNIDGVDIIKKRLGIVTGLPQPKKGIYYIVSLMVAQALPNRKDLLIPGELLRDDTGRIVGCKNLCRL